MREKCRTCKEGVECGKPWCGIPNNVCRLCVETVTPVETVNPVETIDDGRKITNQRTSPSSSVRRKYNVTPIQASPGVSI